MFPISVSALDIALSPHPSIGTGIIFPDTGEKINDEVHDAISNASHEIAAICSIPGHERNEKNTIIRLEEILTKLDHTLQKYLVLSGLFPDKNLQNASLLATKTHAEFIQRLSADAEIYACIRETKPESVYGHWLKNQELRFFRDANTDSIPDENELTPLYEELFSLQNDYIRNIRENRPLTENLQIIERSASIRSDIAFHEGYETWTDLKADRQGWSITGSDIALLFDNITPTIKQMIQPIIREIQTNKEVENSSPTIYDYEIDRFISEKALNLPITPKNLFQSSDITINRTLMVISCLLNVKTEEINNVDVYAPGVSLFRVSNISTNKTHGWFYLDLKNRSGKTQEWLTAQISGIGYNGDDDGSIISAPVFIVSGTIHNQNEGTRMQEEDYTLMFHEFGHLYTLILTGSSESAVPVTLPIEMTEASSRLFEYIAWTPEILAIIQYPANNNQLLQNNNFVHLYAGSQDPYSDEHRWNLAKDTIISLLDLKIAQSREPVRFNEWYQEIYTHITGAQVTDQGGYLLRHPHFSGDTAGMYWIYPIGDVYATLLYAKIFESGILNKSTWKTYTDGLLYPEQNFLFATEWIKRNLTEKNSIQREKSKKNWTFIPGCISDHLLVRGIIAG